MKIMVLLEITLVKQIYQVVYDNNVGSSTGEAVMTGEATLFPATGDTNKDNVYKNSTMFYTLQYETNK